MERVFCKTALWDSNLTWNTDTPDFTPCFENTVLIIVPCSVLLLCSPIYILYLCRWPRTNVDDPLPLTRLGAIRTILSLVLIFLSMMKFFRTLNEEISGLEPELSLYIAPIILALTLVWTIVLMHVERKKAVISSGPLFTFWFVLTICGSAELFTVSKASEENDLYRAVVQYVFYGVLIIQLIASCIVDVLPYELTVDKKISPEARASFLSYFTFHWLNRLCWTGFRKTLTQADVYTLHPRDRCGYVVPQLEKHWQYELSKKAIAKPRASDSPPASENAPIVDSQTVRYYQSAANISMKAAQPDKPNNGNKEYEPSLLKALLKTHGSRMLVGHSCKLVYDMLQFVSPLALQSLIKYAQDPNEPQWHGYIYALIIFSAGMMSSVLFQQLFHMSFTVGIHIKSALISLIYKKSLTMTSEARRDSAVGEIVNLMSVDTERILQVISFIWIIWSAPLQIAISMILLWRVMGTAVFAGLAVMLLLLPINGLLAAMLRRQQAKQMRFKDKRSRLISEVLSGIKILKLYTWENSFRDRVNEIREQELIVLKKAAYLQAIGNFVLLSAPFMVMLASFMTYVYTSDEPLTPDKAFVALTLFNNLRAPLGLLPNILSFLAQASVAVARITRFLTHPDLDKDNVQRNDSTSSDSAIEMIDGKFSWSRGEAPVIADINLNIDRGKLVAIVGPVGCGKSSLLSAMLGDMERMAGQTSVAGSTAYVAQQAWIQNATIRNNVLFGQPFVEDRYKRVIEACALEPDLQILPDGDSTEIGEKGINLSGGQKQRVALARAVYQDNDIVLLDDPLSAVDAHVGKHIFESVIGPRGMLAGKTRLLVTHGLQWLPHCDEIIVMANGKITDVGTLKDLLTKGGSFASFIREYLAQSGDAEAEVSEMPEQAGELLRQIAKDITKEKAATVQREQRASRSESTSENKPVKKPPSKLIADERQEAGGVKWSIFLAYFRALGILMVAGWITFMLVSQGFAIFGNIWLTTWTSDPNLLNATIANTSEYVDLQNYYLGFYGMACAGQALFILLQSLLFALSSVKASRFLHQNMLENILHCAMSFFDTTPTGRILNRFGKDVDTIDNQLPNNLRQWMTYAFQVLVTIFFIIYGFPLFAAVIVPLAALYYLIQRFYVPTTRQLKRIESVSRSPIYNHFSETLSGAATIRAFGEENRFMTESAIRVDRNNMSYFAGICSNRWLGVRLELIGNITVFIASLFAIFYRNTTSSSLVGLSISYSLQITTSLNWLIRTSSDLESNVVAVERLEEYIRLPNEASWERQDTAPPANWPPAGEIILDNYATRYRAGLDLVLKGISCTIMPGEKIGIVGRTGAGKSSLTLALFRLIESASGRILIDKVDISCLGLHQLRSRLTILPQDPVVFSGSVRRNIDPFSVHSDQALWKAIEQAGLRDFVSGVDKGLEHECGENGESLSVGQRQLLCLARDEATAAVDVETDQQIMRTIRREFSECTVLIIAHRLHTVQDTERVLVLDKGEIVEFDSPQTLLANPESLFSSMARSAQSAEAETQ